MRSSALRFLALTPNVTLSWNILESGSGYTWFSINNLDVLGRKVLMWKYIRNNLSLLILTSLPCTLYLPHPPVHNQAWMAVTPRSLAAPAVAFPPWARATSASPPPSLRHKPTPWTPCRAARLGPRTQRKPRAPTSPCATASPSPRFWTLSSPLRAAVTQPHWAWPREYPQIVTITCTFTTTIHTQFTSPTPIIITTTLHLLFPPNLTWGKDASLKRT